MRAWQRAAAKYLDQGLPVVVDDVRYLNEAAAIWDRGGILIRIDRAGAGSASGASHASESGGLPWNLKITNCGDPRAFGAALDGIVRLRGD